MALFGKKKEEEKVVVPKPPPVKSSTKREAPKEAPKEATYFGKNIKITGKVSGNGDLIILGEFEGEFDVKGKLQIAEPAKINGTVKANDIQVKGNIQGTVTATEKIHLDSTAKVQGQVNSPRISVMEGALFDGEIKMSGPSQKAWAAPVSETTAKPSVPVASEKKQQP
jgi:cytoskeletal protein CcmA (bactofilin family)